MYIVTKKKTCVYCYKKETYGFANYTTCAIYIAAMWNQSAFSFGNYEEKGVPIPILFNFGQVVSPE